MWLVGPAGSGKTTWAGRRFRPGEIVSSDELRSRVGTGAHDLDASADAFAVLERIAEARLRRGLTTVVDTLGFDLELRSRLSEVAATAGLPRVTVCFDTPEPVCRERNRSRDRSVPAKVLTGQVRRYRDLKPMLVGDGWSVVVADDDPLPEPSHSPGAAEGVIRQRRDPTDLSFFLHVATFDWSDDLARDLPDLARAAEAAGFEGISVMDHLRQIPQVGRPWEPLPEALTTLSVLAGATDHLRLSVLVANVTLRHPAVLGKMLATLDVLSGGRVEFGIGAGWFEDEQAAFGIPFPSAGERLDLLEDTLRFLPVLWGPGGRPFEGKVVTVADSSCYPRPIQEHIPLIVGGGGERRTLRLAAAHADGCNLSSDPAVLARKLDVLHGHCEDVGRDPDDLLVSVLDVTVCAPTREELGRALERIRGNRPASEVERRLRAGTVEGHIGRYRMLAEMGTRRVYVSPADLNGPETVERLAPVVETFRTR